MSTSHIGLPKWAAAAAAASLVGCSIHPIPDDVSRYATEDIVRNVRCEAKAAVKERIILGLQKHKVHGVDDPERVLENPAELAKVRRQAPDLARKFQAYGVSTIGYTFDFMINETDDRSGALGFQLPFVNGDNFTLALDGGVHKERNGHRSFKTVETFKELVNLKCGGWVQPDRNLVYPLTGSIGVGKIMHTFIGVSEIGGGSGDFADTIVFTTKFNASIKPSLELAPVANRFRRASASATLAADREDIHQVTIAISFPQIDLRPAVASQAVRASPASLAEDTKMRALQNMCITNAREREDRFNTLRLAAPEEYCRRGAASFQRPLY